VVVEEREKAENTHNIIQHSHTLKIYTDGSGYKDHIGSAAVVPDLNTCSTTDLGTESTSTVHAAELRGRQMALAMVKSGVQAEGSRWRERATKGRRIFSDSQAGLKALVNP
jgi:hypothetical protein